MGLFSVRERCFEDDVSTAVPSPRSSSPDSPLRKKKHHFSEVDKETTNELNQHCCTMLCATPPETPRQHARCDATTPPARKTSGMPMLMQALMANSPTLVLEAIREEPDVARFPFWDFNVEPPLCFAVRHQCKIEIIELLLQHGAELDAKDMRGRTPAELLEAECADMDGIDSAFLEKLLGAQTSRSETQVQPSERFRDCLLEVVGDMFLDGSLAGTPMWEFYPGSIFE